jgi:hypothetical protein
MAPQEEDFTDVIFNLQPLDFQLLHDDGDTIRYEAVRHTAAPGAPVYALAVSAPSPAAPADRERLEQLLRDPVAGLDEGARLSFEAELRDVNRNCLGAAGVDLLVAVDPSINNGEVDTWKAIGGILRSAKIKVTAGRAELQVAGSSSSSAASAVNFTATLKAKKVRVVGRRNGSSYTFVGKFALA